MKIGATPPSGKSLSGPSSLPQKGDAQPLETRISLPRGRLFLATVLTVRPEGEAVLVVEGQRLSAQTMTPLTPGQQIWLEVVQEGASPLLETAAKKGSLSELVRLIFSSQASGTNVALNTESIRHLQQLVQGQVDSSPYLEQILTILQHGVTSEEVEPDATANFTRLLSLLARITEKSVSTKSANLHPLLQELAADVSAEKMVQDGHGPNEIGEVSKLLRLLEGFGHVNNQSVTTDQSNFFLFPCFFTGKNGWGEWTFRWNDGKEDPDGEEKRHYGLSFFLDMSRLGDVHLQVDIGDATARGIFSVTNQDVAEHLAYHLPELQEILQGHGYQRVHLSCQLSEKSHMQALQEGCSELAQVESFVLVDRTV